MDNVHNSGLAHLCHHDIHWEFCYDYAGRVEFIRARKPAEEIEPRLKYFGLVPDELLPAALRRANAALAKADAAWRNVPIPPKLDSAALHEVQAAWDKAEAAWDEANAAWQKSKKYQATHDCLWPNCPWNEKQETMFPEEA